MIPLQNHSVNRAVFKSYTTQENEAIRYYRVQRYRSSSIILVCCWYVVCQQEHTSRIAAFSSFGRHDPTHQHHYRYHHPLQAETTIIRRLVSSTSSSSSSASLSMSSLADEDDLLLSTATTVVLEENSNTIEKKDKNKDSTNEKDVSNETTTTTTTITGGGDSSIFSVPVLTTALLIAGNEIGASCLVLPDAAAGPGMAAATGLFLLIYVFHLVSGVTVSEVAIKQYEATPTVLPPSSFRAFADGTFQNPSLSNTIGVVSIFGNFCVLAFNIAKAGTVGASLLSLRESTTTMTIATVMDSSNSGMLAGVDPSLIMSVGFVIILATIVGTQSRQRLSSVGSLLFCILVTTFACVLLPGLITIDDPLGVFTASLAPTDDTNRGASLLHMAPIAFQAAFYQNLVPTVTKILKYDRTQTVAALTLGSFLPTLLFIAWTFCVLGGGVSLDAISGSGGGGGSDISFLALRAFSCVAVCGSALGCTMAISEELDAFKEEFLSSASSSAAAAAASSSSRIQDEESNNSSNNTVGDTKFSLLSVLAATLLPLGAGLFVSSTAATSAGGAAGNPDIAASFLFVAGAFATPLLCGPVPVAMAYLQRKQWPERPNIVPTAGLVLVCLGSLAFVLEESTKITSTFG